MHKVLVVDFGSQYSQLIVRKVRELGFYSEIISCTLVDEYMKNNSPDAIILSGGPESVYDEKVPLIEKNYIDGKVPVLGICYGMQVIMYLYGGKIDTEHKREYGFTKLNILKNSLLLEKTEDNTVWMSHGDSVSELPEGFELIATTEGCPHCVVNKGSIYGVQFHPEVHHTKEGKKILSNFLINIAELEPDWTMADYIDYEIKKIREKTKGKKVICALSGGVDSTVMTALLARAIGDRLTAIYIDNGLMRKNETEGIKKLFATGYDFNLDVVNAEEKFLSRLEGISDPEKKRKIIGKTFIEVFEKEAKKINA
ncbi:MAG: glutamine-hydrolyzing GMP synthase, partial [Candidatus Muiribacteriota bacterium]